MNPQYIIIKAFPGFAVGDILSPDMNGNYPSLSNPSIVLPSALFPNSFSAPYMPSGTWSPIPGNSVWTFDELMNVVNVTYGMTGYLLKQNLDGRLATLQTLGLVFPDQPTAQKALNAMLSSIAGLMPTNQQFPPKLI